MEILQRARHFAPTRIPLRKNVDENGGAVDSPRREVVAWSSGFLKIITRETARDGDAEGTVSSFSRARGVYEKSDFRSS